MAEQPNTKTVVKKLSEDVKEAELVLPGDISKKLSAKLQKRPTAKEVGLDSKLAPTLQATAKKLQTEQTKDIVDKTLKTRHTPKEAGIDTTIAPSIQPQAQALKSKMRRDSLKQSLSARPDIQELIDSNILKPYTNTLANSLQLDAAKLEEALAGQVTKEYLQQIGILDPYKKNVDSANIDIEQASGLLLRALVYRKSYGGVIHEKGGTQFGFDETIAPTLQDTAHHLQVQQKKDKLSQALQQRPSPRGVMSKQVEVLGYDSKASPTLQQTIKDLGQQMIKDTLTHLLKDRIFSEEKEQKEPSKVRGRRRASSFDADTLAPSLQGIANKLAHEQKKNALSDLFKAKASAQDLIDKGILKAYATSLADRLQLNADMLEQQLAARVDEEYLKQIGVLEPYKKNVDTSPISPNVEVESKANLILKSLIVKHRRRRESGGDKSEIAPTLQATAKQLQKKQTIDTLKKNLAKKPVTSPVSIDNTVAPALQATKKKLETAQKKDTISKTLQTRDEPQNVGVDMKISPAIQSIALSLKSKMRRDSLTQKMNARPDRQHLIDSGVLKPYSLSLAKSLQLDAAKLENALANQVSKQYLQEIGILDPYKKNVDRESIDIEKASGLLLRALVYRPNESEMKSQTTAFGFSDIAPTLQQTAHTLEVQQKKDKLSAALVNRGTPRGIMQKQAGDLGYDINAAPSLQQTIKELGTQMLRDVLTKALRERPSAESIGVDTKNASAIQGAMHDLENKMRRDSVSKGMRDRVSPKEAGVDVNMARQLQGIAKTLEMEMKSDIVKHKMQDVGRMKRTNTESVIAKVDQCIEFIIGYQL